jgi:hypothetical protein
MTALQTSNAELETSDAGPVETSDAELPTSTGTGTEIPLSADCYDASEAVAQLQQCAIQSPFAGDIVDCAVQATLKNTCRGNQDVIPQDVKFVPQNADLPIRDFFLSQYSNATTSLSINIRVPAFPFSAQEIAANEKITSLEFPTTINFLIGDIVKTVPFPITITGRDAPTTGVAITNLNFLESKLPEFALRYAEVTGVQLQSVVIVSVDYKQASSRRRATEERTVESVTMGCKVVGGSSEADCVAKEEDFDTSALQTALVDNGIMEASEVALIEEQMVTVTDPFVPVDDPGLGVGVIVGIACGGVVAILLMAVAALMIVRKVRKDRRARVEVVCEMK